MPLGLRTEPTAYDIVVKLAQVEDPAADGFCSLCREHEHTKDCPWVLAQAYVNKIKNM